MTERNEGQPDSAFVGAVITALEPTRDSAERIKVRVGRRVVAMLRAHDVAEMELRVGTQLDEPTLARIQDRARFVAAMDSALKRLRHRARTEAEMRVHLLGRSFDPAHVESVIERLRELNLIDDRDFARQALEQVQRRAPAGERLMRHVLDRHGVEEQAASEMLEEARRQLPSAERQARELIESRLAAMQALPPETQARRLLALLARRGFEEDLAERLVREIVDLAD